MSSPASESVGSYSSTKYVVARAFGVNEDERPYQRWGTTTHRRYCFSIEMCVNLGRLGGSQQAYLEDTVR